MVDNEDMSNHEQHERDLTDAGFLASELGEEPTIAEANNRLRAEALDAGSAINIVMSRLRMRGELDAPTETVLTHVRNDLFAAVKASNDAIDRAVFGPTEPHVSRESRA